MNTDQHSQFMKLALKESKKALPGCFPNPPVGCILVTNGVVIASGYTREPGLPHAEADALGQYLGALADVSAYVTLEPCSFHGRTSSCAQTRINRRIGHVYVAMRDPDPRNNGNGVAMLKNAGVMVTENMTPEAVSTFLSPYLSEP